MRILFLTNNSNTQPLIDWLRKVAKEEVIVWEERLSKKNIEKLRPDLLISYNYKFIIKKEILDLLPNRAINLHISYLPWNRGAHPNLWSFIEDTPKGVTIHYIDEGIDTGDILFQKEVFIDEDKETFKTSYEILHEEIQRLFKVNWEKVKSGEIRPRSQTKQGTIHYKKDSLAFEGLIKEKGWDTPISEFKEKYRLLRQKN